MKSGGDFKCDRANKEPRQSSFANIADKESRISRCKLIEAEARSPDQLGATRKLGPF
jgi:hypothetical protein